MIEFLKKLVCIKIYSLISMYKINDIHCIQNQDYKSLFCNSTLDSLFFLKQYSTTVKIINNLLFMALK